MFSWFLEMEKIIPTADWREVPWKNGKGTTSEIAIDPAGEDFSKLNFRWRLSSARLKEAGEFSLFPGYERVLLIIEGKELVLFHEDEEAEYVRPMTYHRFSGSAPTRCEIPEGPVRDLNFIFRPNEIDPLIEVLQCPPDFELEIPGGQESLLFVIDGGLRIKSQTVGMWQTLWCGKSPEHRKISASARHNRLLKITF
jgi:environmental stress-induced protein Ves